MNWLRSKAKRLSLLALFALALQLGLCSAIATTMSPLPVSRPASRRHRC